MVEFDGYIIGSPTRFGRLSAQVSTFFDSTGKLWKSNALAGKFGGVFSEWGNERAFQDSIESANSFFFNQIAAAAIQHGGIESTALTTLPFYAHHGIIFVPIGEMYPELSVNEEIIGSSSYGASTIVGATSKLDRPPTDNDLSVARVSQIQVVGTILRRMLTYLISTSLLETRICFRPRWDLSELETSFQIFFRLISSILFSEQWSINIFVELQKKVKLVRMAPPLLTLLESRTLSKHFWKLAECTNITIGIIGLTFPPLSVRCSHVAPSPPKEENIHSFLSQTRWCPKEKETPTVNQRWVVASSTSDRRPKSKGRYTLMNEESLFDFPGERRAKFRSDNLACSLPSWIYMPLEWSKSEAESTQLIPIQSELSSWPNLRSQMFR